MDSSTSFEIFDPFRNKWIKNRPEEVIRINIIHKLVHEYSYPLSLIAIEKQLSSLPHLNATDRKKVPNRRIDIVVFGNDIHPKFPLFPLLLIECKAVPLNPEFASQVVGYNDIVKAPFIALANETTVLTGQYDMNKGGFHFFDGLIDYKESKKRCSGSI